MEHLIYLSQGNFRLCYSEVTGKFLHPQSDRFFGKLSANGLKRVCIFEEICRNVLQWLGQLDKGKRAVNSQNSLSPVQRQGRIKQNLPGRYHHIARQSQAANIFTTVFQPYLLSVFLEGQIWIDRENWSFGRGDGKIKF